DKLNLADDCLVMLLGDQGLALGEHGICGPHRPWLHDELIHLPLLIRLPATSTGGSGPGGRRAAALTQTVDLAPTLLEAFGLPAPPELHGRSLLPLAREEAGAVTREYVCGGLQIGDAIEWYL